MKNLKQSLDQALIVAKDNKVDIEEIERWSKVENSQDKFILFLNLLSEKTLLDKR